MNMQGNRVSKANTIQIRVNRYKNTRFDSKDLNI